MVVVGHLTLLSILVVGAEKAEDGEHDMVKDDEEWAELEDSHPDVPDLLRNELRVVEVSDLQA